MPALYSNTPAHFQVQLLHGATELAPYPTPWFGLPWIDSIAHPNDVTWHFTGWQDCINAAGYSQFSLVCVSITCVTSAPHVPGSIYITLPSVSSCSACCAENLDFGYEFGYDEGCNRVMTDSMDVAGWYVCIGLPWFTFLTAVQMCQPLMVGIQGNRLMEEPIPEERAWSQAWVGSGTIGGVAWATLMELWWLPLIQIPRLCSYNVTWRRFIGQPVWLCHITTMQCPCK